MKWIKKTFSDDSGNASWMRQAGTVVILTILINWTYCIFKDGHFIPLDWSSLGTLIGVFASKAYQKSQESC